MTPDGNPNIDKYKFYSAIKTGYEHLNQETFIKVPEQFQEDMANFVVPDFDII
jgi:hypothetical protein